MDTCAAGGLFVGSMGCVRDSGFGKFISHFLSYDDRGYKASERYLYKLRALYESLQHGNPYTGKNVVISGECIQCMQCLSICPKESLSASPAGAIAGTAAAAAIAARSLWEI